MRAAEAIADGVRRQILELLRRGPMPVNQVWERFAISRPAISRHLRILREHGLVRVESRGRERWCHLELAPLAELEAWLAGFRSPWEPRLDALATEVARTRRERREQPASGRTPQTRKSSA